MFIVALPSNLSVNDEITYHGETAFHNDARKLHKSTFFTSMNFRISRPTLYSAKGVIPIFFTLHKLAELRMREFSTPLQK